MIPFEDKLDYGASIFGADDCRTWPDVPNCPKRPRMSQINKTYLLIVRRATVFQSREG